MNDRIQQLAKQAHFYQEDDNYFTAAQEQFARLIVRECMQIIKVDMYEDAISNMWSKNKLQMIKEHFGVEE